MISPDSVFRAGRYPRLPQTQKSALQKLPPAKCRTNALPRMSQL